MPVTKLKALHIVDPIQARRLIVDAFRDCHGNGKLAAERLKTQYQNLARIIKEDHELAGMIAEVRKELIEQGFPQVGFGETQMKKLEEWSR